MAKNMDAMTRWQRAAQRALAADLPHQLRLRGSAVLVPSKSQDGVSYHVRVAGNRVGQCDCPAGLAGKPCAHRAAVAVRMMERTWKTRITALRPAGVAALERLMRAPVVPQPAPTASTLESTNASAPILVPGAGANLKSLAPS